MAARSRKNHQDLRIGTLAGQGERTAEYIDKILPLGFESFQINFWSELPKGLTLKQMAKQINDVLDKHADATGERGSVSSIGMFGNPLANKKERTCWKKCIDACEAFGCDIVAGFAGALEDRNVADNMKEFKRAFGPLAKHAKSAGVRLAFENCDMNGNWDHPKFNIAHTPKAWEMMFNEVPDKNMGLEWEPCHQLYSLVDPLPQLKEWLAKGKIFHVHGKDATVHWDIVRRQGIRGGEQFAYHRHPGFGDTNWTDVISILRQGGFRGAIDIEGWHDPVYREDLEMTGQVYALNYLKQCRGGDYVPQPKGF